MSKNFIDKYLGKEFSLRERLFRLIMIVGLVLSSVGIVECILVSNINEVVYPLAVLFVAMAIGMVLTYKYRKLDAAAIIIGIAMIGITFPLTFFLCGGIGGGASAWFALGLFYLFMMFSGKVLAAFLLFTLVVDILVYVFAYLYPYLVIPMQSDMAVYVDSLFAVVVIGICGGAIMKFQTKLFDEERAVVLKQKEEIQKIGESKTEFFAKMSHEVRTPINTIMGLNEIVLRENQQEEIEEYAKNIQSASKMLLSLVNDMLDVSSMENQQLRIYPKEYKTEELFRELIDMVSVGAESKELKFVTDIDEQLPSKLYGDAKRIKQVLLNILTNAIKYTNEGTISLSVGMEKIGDGVARLNVSVSDTGIGIRKESIPYLYDPYKRMEVKSHLHVEGVGLGLAVAKQLVDLMGGEITVDSIYTKGSTFTVELDQKIVDETPIGKLANARTVKREADTEYKPVFEASEARVLVVDDTEMNTYVIQKLLEKTRVQIDVARSGAECLEMTKKKFYHVILLDYRMPDMTGSETLRQLRMQTNGLCRNAVVVLMTASGTEEAQRLAEEGRFDNYLKKPIGGLLLERMILQYLPKDVVEHRSAKEEIVPSEALTKEKLRARRKRVYITTDCACDLPEHLLEKHDIKMMYLYVQTEHGRFSDTREINSDNLSQYLTDAESSIISCSASVEEYEAFFGDILEETEHIVHISLAQHSGKSYSVAKKAAESFDHVSVVDAGHISGGQGLVVLYAARLAEMGYTSQEICDKVEEMKQNVKSTFILPSAEIFCQNGHAGELVAKLCGFFGLYPVVGSVKSKIVLLGILGGGIMSARKFFARNCVRGKRRVNKDIVIVTHVSCNVKELEVVINELQRKYPFEQIIVQKASFTNACNAGVGTIGIAYYTDPKKK